MTLKVIIQSDSESDEDECLVEFDDSSSDEALNQDNSCFACLSNDDWGNDKAWIGCMGKNCSRWFHKVCVSDSVLRMTQQELDDYEFYCHHCRKNQQ